MCALRPVLVAVILTVASLSTEAKDVKSFADLAKEVKAKLPDGETSVAIAPIRGPNNDINGGPGFRLKIKAALEGLKEPVSVKDRGTKFTLQIDYRLVPNEIKGPDELPVNALRFDVKLMDFSGKAESTFEITVFLTDERQILDGIGPSSLELPTDKTDRKAAIEKAAKIPPKPALTVEGEVQSAKKGKFGMEILVDGKVRPAKDDGGFAFVELKEGEQYVVRLFNHDPKMDMAADLSIDGINVFEFSKIRQDAKNPKSPPKFKTYIIPAGKSIDIPGWHKDLEEAFKFEIGKFADSAAAQLSKDFDSGTIGQITAQFSAAWKKGDVPPEGDDTERGPDGPATKIGPPTKFTTKEVEMEFGKARGAVTIRYTKPEKKEK